MVRERWWWNGKWGRLARRDLEIHRDEVWSVEAPDRRAGRKVETVHRLKRDRSAGQMLSGAVGAAHELSDRAAPDLLGAGTTPSPRGCTWPASSAPSSSPSCGVVPAAALPDPNGLTGARRLQDAP
jgi:hypothetical protein